MGRLWRRLPLGLEGWLEHWRDMLHTLPTPRMVLATDLAALQREGEVFHPPVPVTGSTDVLFYLLGCGRYRCRVAARAVKTNYVTCYVGCVETVASSYPDRRAARLFRAPFLFPFKNLLLGECTVEHDHVAHRVLLCFLAHAHISSHGSPSLFICWLEGVTTLYKDRQRQPYQAWISRFESRLCHRSEGRSLQEIHCRLG
mmetsp:Transcript_54049/g.175678  ORF Transcript_54049/g.175678 Transcript_54049/m.175678 type:complete len:200 (+) Transcript_54049:340-939(+)